MDTGKNLDKEIVHIDVGIYDTIYCEWVLKIFGKAMDDSSLMSKFDRSLGLEVTYEDYEIADIDNYSFIIKDKKKFMIAKLKYGF
jgi:hypothetical protein